MALAVLLFTNGSNVTAAPDPSPTYVWGDIDVNATWVSGSLYIVNTTSPISITNGAVLTIQPGAEVRFDNGTGLIVEDGKLIADASNSPALITFTSNYTYANTFLWDGITIGESGSGTFKNVAIKFSDTAIDCNNGTIDISNVNISSVNTGVNIVKDTTALNMVITKLKVNDYDNAGLVLSAQNLTLNLELKDSVFTGNAGSIGIEAISNHLTTGAAVITLDNVSVTGGDTGAHLLAQTQLSASIVNCKFNAQTDIAVMANAMTGNSTMNMQGTTIDGRGSIGGQTIYTVNEEPVYKFQMIEPVPANRTSGAGGLDAVLPWNFTYNGVAYTDVFMARNGSVRVGPGNNWIAPCNNINLAADGISSFYGYVVTNKMAVFQWSVFITGENSNRMDVFQLVLYPDGNITFVYDMMESNAVGQAFLKVSSGPSFDIDMVIGNPFDLGHTSYTMRPQDLSAATGLIMTTFDGNITLNVNNSILRNLGDGAIWTFAGNGKITEDMTNSQILNVHSDSNFGAVNVWTLNGTVDVEISHDVFNTIWGYAFWVESSSAMGGSEVVAVNDNQFVRCAFTGMMDTNVDSLSQTLRSNAIMSMTRTFNNNTLTDCGIFTSSVTVNVVNNGWTLMFTEQMVGNDFRTIMYTGMLPFQVDVSIAGEAMLASRLDLNDLHGTAKNNVWHNLTVTDNVIDGLPTFTGFNGVYYNSVPDGIVCAEVLDTSESDNAIWSKVDILDNSISASGATGQTLIVVGRDIRSQDGNRTSDLQTSIMNNELSGAGSDGVQITLWDGAYDNFVVPTTNVVGNVVKVVNNTISGCDLVADVGFTHMIMNQVGKSTVSDTFWFKENDMTECGQMLTFDNDYTNGFDDFYPLWGSPVSSSMEATYQVQVMSNTFQGDDVGATCRVDVTARTTVPGNAIYCSASSTVNGSVIIQGNNVEMMPLVMTEPLATFDPALSTTQYFYADGRGSVTIANTTTLMADNDVSGDGTFNGIEVFTGAFASTIPARDDLTDHPIVTLLSSVTVRDNMVTGAYEGINVTHFAQASNALSGVQDTYTASISNNAVDASFRGIWASVSDQTQRSSINGKPTVKGTQTVLVSGNDVTGDMETHGIQLNLGSISAYAGGLTASVDFTVSDNTVTDCDEGIYAEMTRVAGQHQNLLVNNNVVTNCATDGIYVLGGMAEIEGNTVMDGTGYGIYVQNVQGIISSNTVSNFDSSGLNATGCYDLEIAGNSVSNCANDDDWGMYIYDGDNLTISHNELDWNYRGLYVGSTDHSSILGNHVTGSTFEGAEFDGLYDCVIEDNVFSDNGDYGVYIDGGQAVVFGNNTVSNNEGIGLDIDTTSNDQIWIYNGIIEYNGGYGIYVDANPFVATDEWYGVRWVITNQTRITFNDVSFNGEITVMRNGSLYLDSLNCFEVYGSSVDGTATLLIEAGGMLEMLNTNMVSEHSDLFEPLEALGNPVSNHFEFIVYGKLMAVECSILHAESIFLGPTSKAELVSCLIADYESVGIWVNGSSPTVSKCTIVGDSMSEGIVVEGKNAFPQIVGCFIIANRHGLYARDADLGAVYDNVFFLNLQAGIYGENVIGTIHDNVFMLNKVEILLKGGNVTISDNQIGWAKMINDLSEYVPIIELVGHHLFGIMNATDGGLVTSEGDLMDSLPFDLDVTDLLLGHVGVMALDCEKLTMTGNWYGMLYQAAYVMNCTNLVFGDSILPSNLTVPYYVGLNSSTMTVPIQCVEGLYAVRTDVNLNNAHIQVLDDALVIQDCTGSIFNSTLKGGDKAILVVPGVPAAGAEGNGFLVKTMLKVHAEEDDGNSVSDAMVTILDAKGVQVATGKTDDNGDFICTVVSYIISSTGTDRSMNPYKVIVEFDNGDVSRGVTAADPVDGTWTTSLTVTADPDWTWTFVGVTVLAIVVILIVVAMIVRKKKV